MTLEYRITGEVRALERLDLEGLRAEWRRRRYGPPPKLRSPDLLARMLAWRIQAEALGGLDVKRRAIGTPYRRPIGTPLFHPRISGEARSHQHAQSVAAG